MPGAFASCNLFIDLLIDPSTRKATNSKHPYPARELFTVTEVCTATCQEQPLTAQPHPCGSREIAVMRIQKDMFEAETDDTSLIQSLMTTWTTDGITSVLGLCCKTCTSVKKADPHKIIEKSRLSVDNGGPPQHLYMLVHAALIIDESAQQSFMASLDFPFKWDFHGVGYTLFSLGFWNGTHYWTKMFKNIGRISGVWMHNDRANGGIARLVSPDHTQLAGAAVERLLRLTGGLKDLPL
ncbi:uncharacterized protein PGTG_22352 [Puccinia graminis f. sp. tritici CRL 75-36-700-3]|uniref:Uncharacterized protein n=1 Tax=Puccinia graminis f. sp. tritici (strain CRL 75-36-700-3 / race SCCL) TaxID=418459 RepID=H6QU58_PUCGT|nr:uncharacterized protein PGTG_22352 [Puccinia graminis f. sp. tritici CRL 75-36-700-3]EHS64472.1 hypothetical protein PGTG_22352 [Puccinia graminis f. sp. tritici CRL 75-36-700-3]